MVKRKPQYGDAIDGLVSPGGNKPRVLTQGDMVLISLARAAKGTTRSVPYEELVLQAWRDFPESFSLRNHPEHPDASDIHKRIYQTLKPMGLVIALGNKIFRMTEKGVAQANDLLVTFGNQASPTGKSSRLARDEQTFVERALASRVFATWQAGELDKLIDYDARMFFQFSTGTSVPERQIRVKFALSSIRKAKKIDVKQSDELMLLAEHLTTTFDHLLHE